MGLFDVLAGMLKVRKEQIHILVIGLNNSGKSTIVSHFKDPEDRSQMTLPTVGFNVEKFQSEYYYVNKRTKEPSYVNMTFCKDDSHKNKLRIVISYSIL